MVFKRLLHIVACIFLFHPAFSQQSYTITNYSVNEGLAQSTVYSVLQDKRGFLWFATYGGGLCRFDGVKFRTYTKEDGLSDNKVYSLMEDSKGKIWIGTRNGLTVFDGIDFQVIPFDNQVKNPQVRDVLEAANGDIWVATHGAGLIRISQGKQWRYVFEDGISSNYLYDIEEIGDQQLLIATRDGISSFNGRRFLEFDAENRHEHNFIRKIIKTKDGNIWYGAYGGGLCSVQQGKHVCIPLSQTTNNHSIMSMIQSRDSTIWVGTFGEGVFKITKDTTININIDNSDLSTNNILKLYEDNLGNIWAGTFLGGVCKVSETAFYSYTKKSGFSDPSISVMHELEDGSILMASMSGGLNVYKDGIVTEHKYNKVVRGNRVTSIFEDKESNLWMASDGNGVYKFSPEGEVKHFNVASGNLPSDQIFSIFQSSDNAMWFGTYGDGLIRFKNGELKSFTKEYVRGLNSNQIMSIQEDTKGNIWLATNGGGVSRYDGKNFEKFELKDAEDFVSIQRDIFGNLWFASNGGGVFLYNGKEFVSYTTEDGLSSNNVNLISIDNANNLWIGTEKGINKIIFELKDTLGRVDYLINKIERYNTEDGLIGIETNEGSVLQDSKGNLWFGTVKGVSKYNPSADRFNMNRPEVQLTGLRLNYEVTDWSEYADSIMPWNQLPVNLVLPFRKNHLTFDFVGINLNVPHGVMYRFFMEGFDEEWKESSLDVVTYSNLPPGQYTFNVIARNEDGLWQQESTKFYFEIDKPLWLKSWFLLSILTLIILGTYVFIKRREREIRRRNLILERTVGERTLELKVEKENIERINQELGKKNDQIIDSIQYAKKIQMAVLPPDELVREKLPDFCIFYQAKDIVSGDFYWVNEQENIVYLAAVDCTGHGVPGAFMSIVGYRLLELIINGYKVVEPAQILDELHMQVLETLHKQKGSARDISDGMDIALCAWNRETNVLQYSGAHNPLYLIRDGKLIEYVSDARPIGMSMMKEFKRFTSNEIHLQKGDTIYIFTDGFADQFGGPKFRKYYYQNFQKFLIEISSQPMEMQQELLRKEFEEWKGDYEQIDDVLVLGVKF